MKILIVHNYYKLSGGEDTVVKNEKKMLESHGHRVFLYTRNNSELDGMSRFKKLLLPICSVFNIRTFLDIRKIIKKEGIEMLHVHNTLALVSPSVYYAGISCKIPVVQTVHNFRLLCPQASFFRNGKVCEDCVKNGLMCSVKHKCYRGSTLQTVASAVTLMFHRMTGIYGKINYICLTEFNKSKLLLLKGVKEKNIFVKPNFTMPDKGKSLTPAADVKEKNYYICVGRLERIKGTDVILKAWKNLGEKAPKLYLYGTGELEQKAKKYISDNKLSNVFAKGQIGHEELMEKLKNAKAMIFPSKCYEGFPMTITESFSVGVPVIAGDFGNGGNLVKDGKTGFKYVYDSPDSLAEAVNRMENLSSDSYEVLSKLAYKEYKDKYTEDINYRMLLDIYEKCAGKNKKP